MTLLNVVVLSGTLDLRTMIVRALCRQNCRPHFAILTVLLFGLFSNSGFCQTYGTATNTITVKVQAITMIKINTSILNLNISGSNAIAGQDQMMTTDQTSTFSWGINSSLKKVTVTTSLAAPKYTLQLAAVNPTVGTAASQVTLSTTANDLLTNLGRSSGSCSLLYTAIALASQGTGTDSHTITFTVATQ